MGSGEFQVCKVGSLMCVCTCIAWNQEISVSSSFVPGRLSGLWRDSYFFLCVAVERITEEHRAQSSGRDGKIQGGGYAQGPF